MLLRAVRKKVDRADDKAIGSLYTSLHLGPGYLIPSSQETCAARPTRQRAVRGVGR